MTRFDRTGVTMCDDLVLASSHPESQHGGCFVTICDDVTTPISFGLLRKENKREEEERTKRPEVTKHRHTVTGCHNRPINISTKAVSECDDQAPGLSQDRHRLSGRRNMQWRHVLARKAAPGGNV